jgi:hypothetical protein
MQEIKNMTSYGKGVSGFSPLFPYLGAWPRGFTYNQPVTPSIN